MSTTTSTIERKRETPPARARRRAFFKGWTTLSIVGFLAVLAMSLIYSVTEQGAELVAWATYGLVFALAITAFVWLVSYVVSGRKRR